MGFKKEKPLDLIELGELRKKGLCTRCRLLVEDYHYLCPKCSALYCKHCPEILYKKGEGCMFCDTQISKNEDRALIEKLKKAKKRKDYSKVEIVYHTERKLCLMCGKEIKGYRYTCANCGALLCVNCSYALYEIDRGCWGCGEPIQLYSIKGM